MHKRIIILLLLLSAFTKQSFAQKNNFIWNKIEVDSHQIDSTELFSFIDSSSIGVLFFCPNNYNIEDSSYMLELNEIKTSPRIAPSIQVAGISYENMDKFDDNPRIDSVLISELDCFIFIKDSFLLNRALKLNPNFGFVKEGLPDGVYRLKIEDKKSCPRNLAAIIYYYQNLLFEIFDPQYTVQEQLKILNDKIIQQNEDYQIKIDIQNLEFERLKKQIKDLDINKKDVKKKDSKKKDSKKLI